ncbi:hypothetical protein CDAR_366741 [Caerostris darwini]|uniref:Uncharacterized protein n=1 Tax=Caerostris darwini TaxID=1538125 RepID=A0AAV4Q6R4_9ARAC|nr:hypothetical protein CDAR_366741 [Caerostris darwini]
MKISKHHTTKEQKEMGGWGQEPPHDEAHRRKKNPISKNNYPTTIPCKKRMQPADPSIKRCILLGAPFPSGGPTLQGRLRGDWTKGPGQQTIPLRGKFKERGGDWIGQRLFVVCVEVFLRIKPDCCVWLARHSMTHPPFSACVGSSPCRDAHPLRHKC